MFLQVDSWTYKNANATRSGGWAVPTVIKTANVETTDERGIKMLHTLYADVDTGELYPLYPSNDDFTTWWKEFAAARR